MKSRFLRLFGLATLGAASLLLVATSSWAQQPRPRSTTSKTSAKPAEESYTIVQIGDEVKAIRTSDMAVEKKRVADDYKKAMKAWRDAKKSDPKAERPPKMMVKTKKTGFSVKTEADKYAAKLQDELDKKGDSKDAKGTAKPGT
jgi:hypothetical protein